MATQTAPRRAKDSVPGIRETPIIGSLKTFQRDRLDFYLRQKDGCRVIIHRREA